LWHIVQVAEMPLVVSNDAEGLKKTSKALAVMAAIGAQDDTEKARASVNLRRGKGKMRNRRYIGRKGPLVVYASDEGISKAFRNLPGVELACVDRLNLLQLAPGGHFGRFVIYTKAAMEKLDSIFGTTEKESDVKKGFKVPRNMMSNPDVTRVINSDEIQSIVRQPKEVKKGSTMKKNPLKNLGAMIKLNPYAKTARRHALLLQVSVCLRIASLSACKCSPSFLPIDDIPLFDVTHLHVVFVLGPALRAQAEEAGKHAQWCVEQAGQARSGQAGWQGLHRCTQEGARLRRPRLRGVLQLAGQRRINCLTDGRTITNPAVGRPIASISVTTMPHCSASAPGACAT
jgi:hypothetical protein